MPAEQTLPLAVRLIDEDGEVDTFLATITSQGNALVLDLDDGRTLIVDRQELLARA